MAQPTFQLVMKAGPKPGQTFALEKPELIVGREAGADIVISDAEVSRKHARIYLVSGGYTIEDLGSTNGTFVSGQRLIGPHALLSGETIMFGEHVTLVYEVIPGYDPMATMVSGGPAQAASVPTASFKPPEPAATIPPEPAPVPTYEPAPEPAYVGQVSPEPAYVGQVPAGPPLVMEEEIPAPAAPKKKSNSRNIILGGCGCLLLLVCCGVVVWLAVQSWNCTGPLLFLMRMVGVCQ